jgi:hypothetical protein
VSSNKLNDSLNLTFCKAYIWIVFHEKTNCVIEVLTTLSIGQFFFFFNNIEISAAVVYFQSIFFNKFSQFDVSNKARPILTSIVSKGNCSNTFKFYIKFFTTKSNLFVESDK